jgi:hypothetical protein
MGYYVNTIALKKGLILSKITKILVLFSALIRLIRYKRMAGGEENHGRVLEHGREDESNNGWAGCNNPSSHGMLRLFLY